MSYAVSAPLQAAMYQAMIADAGIVAAVGTHVYDALPSGTLPDLYITLGPESVRGRSDKTGQGALHEMTISVITNGAGFSEAKEAAGAVTDALNGADLTLTRGQLVWLDFIRARARRAETGDIRRIDLIFRARVDDV